MSQNGRRGGAGWSAHLVLELQLGVVKEGISAGAAGRLFEDSLLERFSAVEALNVIPRQGRRERRAGDGGRDSLGYGSIAQAPICPGRASRVPHSLFVLHPKRTDFLIR